MSEKQIAMPGSHDRIIDLMTSLPRGKVLDAPGGSGALANRLKNLGFDVVCADIDAGNFQSHDEIPFASADFNRDRLPFEDGEFDYVICSNGLHRLYYPKNIVEEFARIVKPGGTMVLTWPNYTSMARRVKYLLTGSIGGSIDRANYDQTISDPAAMIRYPLTTSRMEYLLGLSGVTISRIETIGIRFYDYLLLPLSMILSLSRVLLDRHIDNHYQVVSGGTTTLCLCRRKG